MSADAKHHKEPLSLQILEKMGQLLTAAFGLVAALAWNDAIKHTIESYFAAQGRLRIEYLYAVVVTVAAVLLSLWIASSVTRVKRRLDPEHPAAS